MCKWGHSEYFGLKQSKSKINLKSINRFQTFLLFCLLKTGKGKEIGIKVIF